jgi:hypothetical protein
MKDDKWSLESDLFLNKAPHHIYAIVVTPSLLVYKAYHSFNFFRFIRRAALELSHIHNLHS